MSDISYVRKTRCDVFTTHGVVKYMLDLSGYTPDRDLSQVRVLEPSCGEGEFVVEIIKRLLESSRIFNFDVNKAITRMLSFYEIDEAKIGIVIGKISAISDDIVIEKEIIKCEDFLLATIDTVDLVIGNPPYIRYEQIAEDKKTLYRSLFSTFRYRSDIYIPFFEKSLKALAPNGKHCFICSNRWFKNQYGRLLRNIIADSFNIQSIVNLEQLNPFQEEVMAYPAITLIEKSDRKEFFRYTDVSDIKELNSLAIKAERRATPRHGDWSELFNRVLVNSNFSTIEDMGFKIGIGVATGADNIFISEELAIHIEEELLLPILTSRDIKGDTIRWGGKHLFNPFDAEGRIIDLNSYPKAQSYLLTHKIRLQERHIAKRNPLFWYRTIDKIDKELLVKPKILLADISTNKYIKIDTGQYYPHHNLYYITGKDVYDLRLLGAVLMSDFITTQLCNLSNTMNGGYPRWQSQYIKKLRMPNLLQLDKKDKDALVNLHIANDLAEINTFVNSILQS